jgi:outer membrane receptor protein involved in Fe transport
MSRLARWQRLMLVLSVLTPVAQAAGQSQSAPQRGPRFISAAWSPGRELTVSDASVLRRRVSLDPTTGTIGEALKEIIRQAELEISYSPRLVPLERPVSLYVQGITVAAALTEILMDVPVDVSVTSDGGLALVRRAQVSALPAVVDSGVVVGQVRDRATGAPIAGATVAIEGTRHSVVTDAGGKYRIGGLRPGAYDVRARYIGYRPASVSVSVDAVEDVTLDITLERSAQQLDQVVVTGTILPTEVKALPTPVSVVREEDIALLHPHTAAGLIRQLVPSAVSWEIPQAPSQTSYSVRGASTFTAGDGQMKVFVDGIEAANSMFAPVDPKSIERIEIIRGPQAAAIYGSDAIGGVVQIFTKRGDPALSRPQVGAEASVGVVQTPYAGYEGVLRQKYAASIRGGGSDLSYNFGAGYAHMDDYLPNGEISRQSNPSAYGGVRFTRGIITADVSGRYDTHEIPSVFNPELSHSGVSFYSKPNYQPLETQNQTMGARLSVAPTTWWQHTLTVGIDRYTNEVEQSQPRLTTPSDTLLTIIRLSQTKASVAYNTSVQAPLGPDVSGALTLGFDHWSVPIDQWLAFGARNTRGSIMLGPGGFISASRTVTHNTGYFAQAQVGIREALYVTAGLRAEENTNFGDSLGTPLSPRVGLSFVPRVGSTGLKLRTSWGRAIRAPSPGLELGSVSPTTVVRPSPRLGPERQQGWDIGLDAAFGARGSLSITYYDQTADNLIQQVPLASTSVPTFQAQNVGRVENTGIELEGTLRAGPLQLKAQYAYVRSRVEELSPGYGGDLRVGDQSQLTPRHTAGGSLAAAVGPGTTVAVGMVYVGSWVYYDVLSYFRCLGQMGPCRNATFALDRNYLITYPGFVKVSANLVQQVTPVIAGFVSVENLTNNQAYEFNNFRTVLGRVATVGLQYHY